MRYHFLSVRYAACLFQLHSSLVQSQTVQSILWNIPDGNLPDLSETFTAGTTLPLSWNGWTSPDYVDAMTTLVDLWVTGFDYNVDPFSQLLIENINVTVPGTYAWTIAIPDSNLANSAKYVLRFKPNTSTYDQYSAQLSSPGFLVLEAAVSSTSTSSSSSTLASSTITTSSTSSTSSTTSTTASSSPSSSPAVSSGLSTGAIGGIGAGVAIAVLALVGVAYFVSRRKRSKGGTTADVISGQEKYVSPSYLVELPARGDQGAAELPAR